MKRYLPHFWFVLLVSGAALGGAIKVWTTGETLRSADLNSNFAHIHNTMVGGHGARLVDSDVSASAAISHSKLATPVLIPKVAAYVTGSASTSCVTDPCLASPASGVTSVTRTSTGLYEVTLTVARADTRYGVVVSSGAALNIHCNGTGPISTTVFRVSCQTASTGAAADASFTFMLIDD